MLAFGAMRAAADQAAPAGGLPDGRAYEQATPVNKYGTNAEGAKYRVQAAIDGGAISFNQQGTLPGAEGAQEFGTYLATRGAEGWVTQGLLPPPTTGIEGLFVGESDDLKYSYVTNWDYEAGIIAERLYRRDNQTRQLTLIAPEKAYEPAIVATSADDSTVLFETEGKLTPAGVEFGRNLYVWREGIGIRLAGVLNGEDPEGVAPAAGAVAGPYGWAENKAPTERGGTENGYYSTNVLFADGEGVYFTALGSGQLYLRLHPLAPQSELNGQGECTEPQAACTVQVSRPDDGVEDPNGPQPAAFMTAATDGSTAFFASPEELTEDAHTGPEPAIGRVGIGATGLEEGIVPALAGGVAVDGSHLYWTDPEAGTIGRAELDGSNPEPNFITGAGNPQGVAVDSNYIYWANAGSGANGAGTIGRAELDGSNPEPNFITGASNPQGVAVDSNYIYWANAGTTAATRKIARAELGGGLPNQAFVTVSGASGPDGVAVDGSFVYWTNPATGAVGRATIAGATPNQAFVTGGSKPNGGVAVDSNYIYWANTGTGTIGRANLNGSSVNQSFLPGMPRPGAIAVDSGHIYWAGNGRDLGNDLYRFEAADGTLADITPDANPSDPYGAEVQGVLGASADGSRVYFAANGVLGDGVGNGATRGNCVVLPLVGVQYECNLYLWEAGSGIKFITRLSAMVPGGGAGDVSDQADWFPSTVGLTQFQQRQARVSDDGKTIVFRSRGQLTDYENHGVPEFYRYRVGGGLHCITCAPTGSAPVAPPTLFSIEAFGRPIGVSSAAWLTGNLSADGGRFFFETAEKLATGDTNGDLACPDVRVSNTGQLVPSCQDVYEWEAPDTGSCTTANASYAPSAAGCLYLISTGTSPEPSFFGGADGKGDDAFFYTSRQLVGQDKDELFDIYDARVGGGLASQNPPPSNPCLERGSCQGSPTAAPPPQSAGSAGFSEAQTAPPLSCRKGFKKAKRHGKQVCVKQPSHHKHKVKCRKGFKKAKRHGKQVCVKQPSHHKNGGSK